MKNVSLLLNVVLAIAVGVLYFLHFKGPSGAVETAAGDGDSTAAVVKVTAALPKEIKASKIVYINADSLFINYDYMKDLKKETESKKSRIETAYQAKAQKLQEEYIAFQQKYQAGMVSQDEGKAKEAEFKKGQESLQAMEKQMEDLAESAQLKNEEVNKAITDYLKEYNKNAGYQYILAYTHTIGSVLLATDELDITKEIVDGLNAEYSKTKSSAPKK